MIPDSVAEFSVSDAVGGVLGTEGQGGPETIVIPTIPNGMQGDVDSNYNFAAGNLGNADYLSQAPTEETMPPAMKIASAVWLAGIGVLLVWSLAGTIRLRKQVSRENWIRFSRKQGIAQVADLDTPFLWGIFKPMIYLPTDLEPEEMRYVVAHEQYHKKRKDYLIKIAVFFVVAIHWFNPLVWVAYTLFTRDMEISCDEAVLLKFKGNIRKQYAGSLLKYAARQSGFVLSPITFGEPAVKSRIKNVLRFKRRGIMLSVLTVICVVSVAAGLVLRPSAQTANGGEDGDNQSDSFVDSDGASNGNSGEENGNSPLLSVESFKAILLENGNFVSTDLQNREINLASIGEAVTDDDSITVNANKFTVIDLDGDGEKEIVLGLQINGVSDYGFEVLHYQGGTVYGSTLQYRAFMDLKADGSFIYSSGAAFSGVGKLTFAEDGRAVTRELNDDVNDQEGKADVTWYVLSADGVNMAFGNVTYSGSSTEGGETSTIGWYGSYIVTDFIIRGVTAMGSDEAEGLMSCLMEYGPDKFNSDGILLEGPVYRETLVSRDEFDTLNMGSGGGYTFETFGIEGDSLLEVTIDNSYEFGNTFYVWDENRILIHHPGGVYFIAERGQRSNIVLSDEQKSLLQIMCYYVPTFSGYWMMENEDFWREFIFNSFTCVPTDENGNYKPVYGEGEHVTVYREDLGFEEGEFKISERYVQEYARLTFGVEMPEFRPAFEDMGEGQTALYYRDGYYYIGDSDFGEQEYRFRDLEVFRERYDTFALVNYDILMFNNNGEQEVVGTVQFHLYYADNANGFVIMSKDVEPNTL